MTSSGISTAAARRGALEAAQDEGTPSVQPLIDSYRSRPDYPQTQAEDHDRGD